MRAAFLVAAVAALGCKGDAKPPGPSGEPTASDEAPTTATAAPPAPSAPPPPAITSIDGAATRAWIAAQRRGSKRIKGEDVEGEIRAELRRLSVGLVGAAGRGRPLRVRWLRSLSPASAAFSVGYKDAAGGRVMVFSVAVIDGGALIARSRQVVTAPADADRKGSFGVDVDADGDGYNDTLVTYEVGWSAGGHSYDGGLIILGSRTGSTIDVETVSSEAELDGDERFSRSREAVIQCWTRIGGTAVLIAGGVTRDDESLRSGVAPEWDLAFYGADRSGSLAQLAASGAVITGGELDTLAARRARDGAAGPLRLTGDDSYQTPRCPAPPIAVPDTEGSYLLVGDLSLGQPGPGQTLLAGGAD